MGSQRNFFDLKEIPQYLRFRYRVREAWKSLLVGIRYFELQENDFRRKSLVVSGDVHAKSGSWLSGVSLEKERTSQLSRSQMELGGIRRKLFLRIGGVVSRGSLALPLNSSLAALVHYPNWTLLYIHEPCLF
jgi:hypothetical protein